MLAALHTLRSCREVLFQGNPGCLPVWGQYFRYLQSSAATAAAGQQQGGERSNKKLGLAHVDHIVAVSSAKGGVGKSTTAVNLAVTLATRLNLRVGLLDGDVHGPSIAQMMNLHGKPTTSEGPQPLMRPKDNFRVKVMSMAFFMVPDQPAVWRGPMVNSAFDRMAMGSDWGKLDVMIVDMPPGTGDAQINLAQRIPLSGALVVSTPQDIALLDVRRGVSLFNKLRVPVLGLIENMSYHQCVACGHKEHTFGEGGVQRTAQELGLDVLGEVPLDIAVCRRSDEGKPIVVSEPQSPCAQAYMEMAQRLHAKLQTLAAAGEDGQGGPKIVVE
ncbi:P-loop containing nucleoside triphosphate hydrolase protein [Dunaliella salina]|uniref:P-loop containing nucleoside triphosphate hydrolase protein n=1 Tax=Dunaliella salina TaxID=3046 RepID=A0ABQ7GKJ1_DUNSA|nr:P-loop containing nucleoside triphosphate hydrolase protein [Dunaliella salina]|eukprot:KAF5835088.1 P-loop containing nucleoside triphosphate hydrolase protein [Dunaliella salina]